MTVVTMRITTQKQMADRRRAVGDCYVCSTALPPKGTGWRQSVVSEHVIPQSLLGPAPEGGVGAWAVKLFVHKACEVTHKRDRDQLMTLLQAIATIPLSEWSETEKALAAKHFGTQAYGRPGDSPVHAITDDSNGLLAASLWFRGMHATLYGSVLPNSVECLLHPPVPVWREDDREASGFLRDDEERRNQILQLVRIGLHSGHVDEVRAWGGKVVYQCVWTDQFLPHWQKWACCWILEFPGVHEWAMTARGVDSPWNGLYLADKAPEGASIVGPEHIERYNRHVGFLRWARSSSAASAIIRIAGSVQGTPPPNPPKEQ